MTKSVDSKKSLDILKLHQYAYYRKEKTKANLVVRRFKRAYYGIVYAVMCLNLAISILAFMAFCNVFSFNLLTKFIISSALIAIASFSFLLYIIRSSLDVWSIYKNCIVKDELKYLENKNIIDEDQIKKGKNTNRVKVLFSDNKENLKLFRISISLAKNILSLFLLVFSEILVFKQTPKVCWMLMMFVIIESIMFIIDVIKYFIDIRDILKGWKSITKSMNMCNERGNKIGEGKCIVTRNFIAVAFVKKSLLFGIKCASFSIALTIGIMAIKDIIDLSIHKARTKYVKFAILLFVFIIISTLQFFLLEIYSDKLIDIVEKEKSFWECVEKYLEHKCAELQINNDCNSYQLLSDEELNNILDCINYYVNVEGVDYVLYDTNIDVSSIENILINNLNKEEHFI